MFRLFVALCLFGGTRSAADKLYNEEPCKKIEGVKDFNVTLFSGIWYRVQVDGEFPENEKEICPMADIVVDKNDVLRIFNYLGGGTSWLQNKLNPSKFRLIDQDDHQELTILATDYRSYAIVYSCSNKSDQPISIEIVARSHEPFTLDFNETIKDVLTENNLGHRNLLSKDMKTCEGIQMVGRGKNEFRDPTANKDRARCKRVKGVEDFDLTRFMGSWYEIQSSVQENRNCGPSNFSLAADRSRLHISSSNDNNGSYELSMNNPASFTKYINLGSRRFLVNYTVLETNYDSYAILYICIPSVQPSRIITLNRKNEITDYFRTKIDEALLKNDLGITYLFLNSQSNCEKN